MGGDPLDIDERPTFGCGHRHTLGVDDLVDRELFDVRWPLHLHPGGDDPWLDPAFKEGIEICPRLPEVDDSPATIDRTGRMKQHPRRRRAIRIDLAVRSIELFLGHPRKLDADTDCQEDSLPW